MTRTPAVLLRRACPAVGVPSGREAVLPEGVPVYLVQSLGSSFTVQAPTVGGLYRIAASDADALGLAAADAPAPAPAPEASPLTEADVWAALRECYDPEIPVNVVDLGLVYDVSLSPAEDGGTHVGVKMTLTAPGCGMGPAIASDARARILRRPGASSAEVVLVWDPPWSVDMASPEGRRALGV